MVVCERERETVLEIYCLVQVREYLQPTRLNQNPFVGALSTPPNELDPEHSKSQFALLKTLNERKKLLLDKISTRL